VTLTFGSLFAGIGGFDLGFERAGMVCKWQVEIDDYATRVLAKHWPNVHRERDIRECGKHNLEPVDVICGGFPCQDISYAGQGAGLNGARSGLFFEAIRLVRELRPRIVVLENVAALLTRGLDRVLGTLAEIGFDAEWHCIPAAAVGAPHIRDRVFVIANTYIFHDDDGRYGSGTIQRQRQETTQIPRRSDVANAAHQLRQEDKGIQSRYWNKAIGAYQRNGIGGPVNGWWDAEPAVGRVANGVPNRVDRLRGLGNAVVPQVAEWIGCRIMEVAK
jgi:DNA (cytosine-5)-methyltransferase 1